MVSRFQDIVQIRLCLTMVVSGTAGLTGCAEVYACAWTSISIGILQQGNGVNRCRLKLCPLRIVAVPRNRRRFMPLASLLRIISSVPRHGCHRLSNATPTAQNKAPKPFMSEKCEANSQTDSSTTTGAFDASIAEA